MTYADARRVYIALWSFALPVGAILIATSASMLDSLLMVLILPWVVVVELVSTRLSCPACRRAVGFGDCRWFGIRMKWWRLIPQSQCECGATANTDGTAMDLRWIVQEFAAWVLVVAGGVLTSVSQLEVACPSKCEAFTNPMREAFGQSLEALGTVVGLTGLVAAIALMVRRTRR